MRLAIGTVQFGTDYGIANRDGQTAITEVERILRFASEVGIDTLDTASLYGQSEAVLGRVLPTTHAFRVVTKTPRFGTSSITATDATRLLEVFDASLSKLNMTSVYGLLIHSAEDLLVPGGEHLFSAMRQLKVQGRVARIGVSLYEPAHVDSLLERFDLDLVQVPVNVLDQRLVLGGHLDRLKARGVEIHARSAFLQGLLLMPIAQVPQYFAPIYGLLARYASMLNDAGCSPEAGALGFLRQLPQVDRVVIGNTSVRELSANVEAFRCTWPTELDYSSFALDDPVYVNPSMWKLA